MIMLHILCHCSLVSLKIEWNVFFFLMLIANYLFEMAVEGADPVRRERLIELLDIDLRWRMHKVSDGQRRRVQICMGLLHPFKV